MSQSLKAAVERVGDFVSLDFILPMTDQGPGCEDNQTFLMAVIDLSTLEIKVFVDRSYLKNGRDGRSKLCFQRVWSTP